MSTTSPALQQVLAELNKAQERIKPAIMADTPVNGLKLSAHLKENNLAPTAENFYTAIKALMHQLVWVEKPAQLVVQESGNKPPVIENQLKAEAARAKIVRDGEQRDKDAKEHAALVAQCMEIIETYNPTKHTRNGSAYDARERDEMQALWIKELHKAKEKSVEYMRSFTKGLAAAKAKRYADRERASERL
jgi:hypothetical protein